MMRISMLVLAAVLMFGCDTSPTSPQPAAEGGHDHSHESGPHGGHLVGLGEEEFHAEWLHDDRSGLVTVYILDKAAKSEVPAGSVTIDVKIGDLAKQHEMQSAAATDSDQAAQFELTDKSLIEALKIAGHGADAKITVEIEGKSYTGTFEHHAH